MARRFGGKPTRLSYAMSVRLKCNVAKRVVLTKWRTIMPNETPDKGRSGGAKDRDIFSWRCPASSHGRLWPS